jgi:hypothetical protein
MPGGRPVEFKVALHDGQLILSLPGNPKTELTALSETVLAGAGVPLEFGKDDKGEVTYFLFHGPGGDIRADRKK